MRPGSGPHEGVLGCRERRDRPLARAAARRRRSRRDRHDTIGAARRGSARGSSHNGPRVMCAANARRRHGSSPRSLAHGPKADGHRRRAVRRRHLRAYAAARTRRGSSSCGRTRASASWAAGTFSDSVGRRRRAFGPELYRLSFGEAFGLGLLADYRVVVCVVLGRSPSSPSAREISAAPSTASAMLRSLSAKTNSTMPPNDSAARIVPV
jgi:hypothetical protein